MKNLTVANDYVEGSATGNQSAVAMLLQTDRSQFENVRFIGNIGTLYIKSSSERIKARSYFRDCYIEGDQDFIVGRGTAVFDHCEIKYWPAGCRRAATSATRARWSSTTTASCSTAATSPRRPAPAA